jgi:ATP-binding protein involved in chromosome partitioning
MNELKKSNIETKINLIVLSDGTNLKGRASDIVIKNNSIGLSLNIDELSMKQAEEAKEKIQQLIKEIINSHDDYKNGDCKISIIFTGKNKRRTIVKGLNHASPKQTKEQKIYIENVKEIIVIASGKGGVGKSTISAMLAQKLAAKGHNVGLIDADIYGPSIPTIFNLHGKPEIDENNRMIPRSNFGVKVNSIGFLADPQAAISWRGPMVSKALFQLISLTNWGSLDYLIIDTPPGTGDIHLSLLQNYHIDGVLMVTTPQKISEIDVARSIKLFQKFNVPVKGIIENMSYYQTPNGTVKIFNGDSASKLESLAGAPIIASIPIDPDISTRCDNSEELSTYPLEFLIE